MDDSRRQALVVEEPEVCKNFRLLMDVRFKLLAFLPIASAAALAFKVNAISIESFIFSLFGLAVTLGVVTYNTRNDQLYNELVGRASKLERLLGLSDGAFANRPQDWFKNDFCVFKWMVNHGKGIGLIYSSSCALWLFGIVLPLVEFIRSTYIFTRLQYFKITNSIEVVLPPIYSFIFNYDGSYENG